MSTFITDKENIRWMEICPQVGDKLQQYCHKLWQNITLKTY